MTGLHSRPTGPAAPPKAHVIAWQARRNAALLVEDMIEATMRRYEMPSVVDVAKRDDALGQLSRILHL